MFGLSPLTVLEYENVSYPAPEDVREGVVSGGVIGTLDLPSVADVRAAVVFDGASKTGLLDLPAEAEVRAGTAFASAMAAASI